MTVSDNFESAGSEYLLSTNDIIEMRTEFTVQYTHRVRYVRVVVVHEVYISGKMFFESVENAEQRFAGVACPSRPPFIIFAKIEFGTSSRC